MDDLSSIIHEYLVGLGFKIDRNSFKEGKKAIESIEHGITKFAGSAISDFALAGAALGTFTVGAVVGISKFISSLGEAQIEYEKLSRQLWTTQDNAMAFSTAMKAMGTSLQDLYLSPTLMQQFQELKKQAFEMQTPAEYKNQMKEVQSITFQFKRMKLEATYALQWIGYYFIKYMSGPVENVKKTLQNINDIITKNMPHWTKPIAETMSWFAEFGIATVHAIKEVIHVFSEIGQAIPRNVKLIGASLSGLALIVESGPIGIITALIASAILMLDDLYTYLHGGKSAFDPFWKKLIGWIQTAKHELHTFLSDLKNNGTLQNFADAAKNVFDIIKTAIRDLKKWVAALILELQQNHVFSEMLANVEQLLSAISRFEKVVTSIIDKLLQMKGTQNVLKDIGNIISGTIVGAFQALNDTIKSITDGINGIVDLFQGNFGGAFHSFEKESRDFLNEFTDLINGVIKGIDKIPGIKIPLLPHLNTSNDNGSHLPAAHMPSYYYPSSNSHSNHTSVQLHQTNNIYGSDAKATADAAHQNMKGFFIRNIQGTVK